MIAELARHYNTLVVHFDPTEARAFDVAFDALERDDELTAIERHGLAWAFVQPLVDPEHVAHTQVMQTVGGLFDGSLAQLKFACKVSAWVVASGEASPETVNSLLCTINSNFKQQREHSTSEDGQRGDVSDDILRRRIALCETVYFFARASVNIELCFAELFEVVALDNPKTVAASFAIGVANEYGQSFEHVADHVARTLGVRWESIDIYNRMLDHNFIPPLAHYDCISQITFRHKKYHAFARRALSLMQSHGATQKPLVSRILKDLSKSTGKIVIPAIDAAQCILEVGLSEKLVVELLTQLEKLFSHKVKRVRVDVYAMVGRLCRDAPEMRKHLREVAEANELNELAPHLTKINSAPRKSAPTPEVPNYAKLLQSSKKRECEMALNSLVVSTPPDNVEALVPLLIDQFGTELRSSALKVVKHWIESGVDLQSILPLLGGLCLDRDYANGFLNRNITGAIEAAADQGWDWRWAWPWLVSVSPPGRLIWRGLERGYPRTESVERWLCGCLEPTSATRVAKQVRLDTDAQFVAAKCLTYSDTSEVG